MPEKSIVCCLTFQLSSFNSQKCAFIKLISGKVSKIQKKVREYHLILGLHGYGMEWLLPNFKDDEMYKICIRPSSLLQQSHSFVSFKVKTRRVKMMFCSLQ